MTSAQTMDPRALPDEPLALDLVNTEFLPDGMLVDLLATDESTRAWLTAAGLDESASGPLNPTRAALRQARAAIMDALSGREVAPLNEVLSHGHVRLSVSADLAPLRTLDADDPAWQPAVMAAANLLDLLEQAPDRIKHCENPACVLWFFDTTRNGTRRWCSMAVCGNRMKAKRHYDRVKARLYRMSPSAAWSCRVAAASACLRHLPEDKQHLSFGDGTHRCLGMHLARLEMRMLLNAVLDRLPGLRLDPAFDGVHIHGMLFRSPPNLPVRFDPAVRPHPFTGTIIR